MESLIYILIAAFMLFCFIEVFFLWRRKRKFSKRDFEMIVIKWKSIDEKMRRDPKHAVIEADILLDFVLQKRGYIGSLGEKLKKAEREFSDIDGVWNAHKLRNRAAHEVEFVVSEAQAKSALNAIKKALWDLGVKL